MRDDYLTTPWTCHCRKVSLLIIIFITGVFKRVRDEGANDAVDESWINNKIVCRPLAVYREAHGGSSNSECGSESLSTCIKQNEHMGN